MRDAGGINARQLEEKALTRSMWGYGSMAILGIVFALLTRSEAILLDGVYSLLSLVMSFLAGKVAKKVRIPQSQYFSFGHAHFEPWINFLRGIMILVLCGLAFFSAVNALVHGGRPLGAGMAVLYGAAAAVGCLVISFLQKRSARKVESPLLLVDAKNWMIDGIISAGAGLAFLGAFFLSRSQWSHLVNYVDPALVVVMILCLVWVPIRLVRDNLWEILWAAPDPTEQNEIRSGVKAALEGWPVQKVGLRMVKMGRYFYLLVSVVLPDDYEPGSLAELDSLRAKVFEGFKDKYKNLVLEVVFTSREEWSLGLDSQVLLPRAQVLD